MDDLRRILSDVPTLGEAVCADWSAPTTPWLCPLFEFGLIRVSGKDASDFLNNQLSNDLGSVSASAGQFSAYCNPKGRLYGVFHIFMRDGNYLLRVPSSTLTSILKRLRLFVLRADVALDEDPSLGGVSLIGADAAKTLDAAELPVPDEVFGVSRRGPYTVTRLPGLCERYEVYAPHAELTAAWNILSPLTVPNAGVQRLYDILSGIANIYPQTSEKFVPQMVNLDLIGSLSFSKGCYPGQEVVARMHYLGKLKRRMYRLSLKSSAPAPGDAVFVPAYSTEQPSGEIVDACKLPDGHCECLAALRMQQLGQGEIRLASPDGARASIQSLPYEVTAVTRAENKP